MRAKSSSRTFACKTIEHVEHAASTFVIGGLIVKTLEDGGLDDGLRHHKPLYVAYYKCERSAVPKATNLGNAARAPSSNEVVNMEEI